MSSNLLKIIALLCMLIDHIGGFLIPECSALFRIIGRIAFPIFAFSLAQGFIKTSNFKKYALRLGFWSIIAQIPFSLLLGKRSSVILTLLLGLLFLKCYDYYTNPDINLNSKFKSTSGLIAGGLIILSDLLSCDYGSYGILTIFIFYKYLEPNGKEKHTNSRFSNYINNNKKSLVIVYTSLNLIMCITSFMASFKLKELFNLQIYCLLALPLIINCNNKKGKFRLKYLFYIFYPAHLFIIYLIRYYVLKPSYDLSSSYYNIMLLVIYPLLTLLLALILSISFKNKLHSLLIGLSVFVYLYFDCKNFSTDIKYLAMFTTTFIVSSLIFYYYKNHSSVEI